MVFWNNLEVDNATSFSGIFTIMFLTILLIIASAFFAFVHGLNTGASLLATSVNSRGLSLPWALLVLVIGVTVAPLVFGTAVAVTLANDLVDWGDLDPTVPMLVSVTITIIVILILSQLKVPSSLTVALVGSIGGYGFFVLNSVEWAVIGKVLAFMFMAPVFGGVVAFLLLRILFPLLPALSVRKFVFWGHVAGFTVLSFAYGSNDSQKMIAVASVGVGVSLTNPSELWWVLVACGVIFGIGSLIGVPRMAATVATGVLPARPFDMVVTEFSSALTMLLSSTAGSPAGLAQTMSGALLGTGLSSGPGKVRWNAVLRILFAWVFTLPVAFVMSGLLGLLLQQVL